MNKAAHDAIENIWRLTIKTRALCPHAEASLIGEKDYLSPPWYRARGAVYIVSHPQKLTEKDVQELNQIGKFVNRSFIISMAAVLEEYGVVPYGTSPDRSKNGGDYVQLTRWLRNRFAHGEWQYDVSNPKHVETRQLLETLFPQGATSEPGFVTSINSILEPLKEGVLAYIRAAT
jgi:hypothetical protein